MMSHYSSLRNLGPKLNPRPKLTGVLEHCREGDTQLLVLNFLGFF